MRMIDLAAADKIVIPSTGYYWTRLYGGLQVLWLIALDVAS